MDNAFKKYLQEFLKWYKIDSNGIDWDCISDSQSIFKQLQAYGANLSTIQQHLEVIFDLHERGIHIYEDNYKTSQQYSTIKDDWIYINANEVISTENYIERFLLDRQRLLDVYANESIYAMGNPYDLADDKCKLADFLLDEQLRDSLTEEEIDEDLPVKSDAIIKEADLDLIKMLLRLNSTTISGGLIFRLRTSLKFYVTEFPLEKEYKAEICKIVYLFLKLEHTSIIPELQGKHNRSPKPDQHKLFFHATDFLEDLSMENIGYAYWKRKTYNGKITDYIKNELEKELYLKETPFAKVDDIKAALHRITNTWDGLLKEARNAIDTDGKFEFDQMKLILEPLLGPRPYDFKDIMRYSNFCKEESDSFKCTYRPSPIEVLYWKILEFECICEIADKIWVNNIEIKTDARYNELNDDVREKFIERMILYKNCLVGNDVNSFIQENLNEIAECVYLKTETSSAERRRIKDNIAKVDKLLDYCIYAGKLIKTKSEVSMLLIISCLQTILLDEKSEEEYNFYDYQYHLGKTYKPKIRIPIEKPSDNESHILSDQIPPDAIKLCLARSVEEHWYANIGKHKLFDRLREFETTIYEMLEERIYTWSNVFSAEKASQTYYDQLKAASNYTEE